MQPALDLGRGVHLREILPDAQFRGANDIQVRSCSSEAAQCRPGDTFVAIASADSDGHEEASLAVARGAVAVVAERVLPVRVPSCLVEDSREAFGRICHRLVGAPGERLRVVGVSGTNGKTTTCHLLAAVLRSAGHGVGICSSLGRSSGEVPAATPAIQTTPMAAELARWLADLEAHGGTHAILEASSAGLAQRRLAGLNLDAAVLTNVRRDHLDLHGNLANYRRAKQRLLAQLKPGGFAVINVDDPTSRQWLRQLKCPVITIGRRGAAEVTAELIERHRSEQTFLISAGSDTIPVRTSMIGEHHVTNCLAAVAVGLAFGIPLTTIVRGLEAVRRIPGRLDRVECGQPFGVFVDAAETPDQLAVCLRALRSVTSGRLICVFSAQEGRRHEERPLLGRVVEQSADLGIITLSGTGSGAQREVLHDLLDGYERPARAHLIPSRHQAISWALSQARRGDSVLIAGSAAPWNTEWPSSSEDREMARRCLDTTPAVIPFPLANELDS